MHYIPNFRISAEPNVNLPTFNMELDLNIPFPSAREAGIAYDALRVEVEPARSRVSRTMQVKSVLFKIYLKEV